MSFTVKELLSEAIKGRVIPTHYSDGRPHPRHPHFEKFKAEYDAKKKDIKAIPKSHPSDKVTINDFHSIGDNVPDEDYYDVVARIARKHKIEWRHAQRGLNSHAKKHGYKNAERAHTEALDLYDNQG